MTTSVEMKTNEMLEKRAALTGLLKDGKFDSWYMYDAKGSDLYEKITTTPEYYICRAEQDVIDEHLANFAPWGSTQHVLVELGAGVGQKTHTMIPAMRDAAPGGNFLYAPIDCNSWALERNKEDLHKLYPDVKCQLLVGLFEDKIEEALNLPGEKTVLFQGSTFGNFKSDEAAIDFIKMVCASMGPNDRFIIGVDSAPIEGKKSIDKVHDCYKKSTNGWREEFMLNALDHARRETGLNFDRANWKRITHWDPKKMAVFQELEAVEDVVISSEPEGEEVMSYKKGDKIMLQSHFKYTHEKLSWMAKDAGMHVSNMYNCDNQEFLWAELKTGNGEFSQKDRDLVVSLLKENTFHTMFLYDAKGSQLYENITKQPEYYLTSTEAKLIDEKIGEIAPWGNKKHILVELGAGVGEKTHAMLPAMKKASPEGQFVYCPIDCDRWCLETNRDRLKEKFPDIECEILVGLYEDMLQDVKKMEGEKTILFLGSTICNFNNDEDTIKFVKMVKDCMLPGDRLIIGVDTPPKEGKKTVDFVHDAYRKSTGGHREEFIMNGLDHANRRAGLDFDRAMWNRVTEWNQEKSAVIHYYEAAADHTVSTVPEGEAVASFKTGDRVLVSTHSKFDSKKLTSIVEASGMSVSKNWMPENEHFLWSECVLKV